MHANKIEPYRFFSLYFPNKQKSSHWIKLTMYAVGNVSACQCVINLLHGTKSSNNHNVNTRSSESKKTKWPFYDGLMWFTHVEYSSRYLHFYRHWQALRRVNCKSVMHVYTLSGKYDLSVNNFEPKFQYGNASENVLCSSTSFHHKRKISMNSI